MKILLSQNTHSVTRSKPRVYHVFSKIKVLVWRTLVLFLLLVLKRQICMETLPLYEIPMR